MIDLILLGVYALSILPPSVLLSSISFSKGSLAVHLTILPGACVATSILPATIQKDKFKILSPMLKCVAYQKKEPCPSFLSR